jgi:hypothetical protein
MSLQFEAYPDLTAPSGIDESEYIGDFDIRGDDAHYEELGVAPLDATVAKPGSTDKVVMLAARYAAGLPLWHDEDCYDHGPGGFPEDDELV